MAVQGMVYQTRECGKDIMVRLAPYETEQGYVDPVGQRRLFIENFTIKPLPGDIMWGGSSQVHLHRGTYNPREIMRYDRKGYARLVEGS